MPQLSPLTSHFSPPPAALPYNSALSLWLSVDPLSDKYPNLSPYTYCANNPVRLVDVDGREIWIYDTKYYDTYGRLLYETNDNLNMNIIVEDGNINKLKSELQTAKNNGTINDPVTNKQKMHSLGKTEEEYSNASFSGINDDNYQSGYKSAYQDAYTKGKGPFSLSNIIQTIFLTFGGDESQSVIDGRQVGIYEGLNDRKSHKINRLNPQSGFKCNPPIIKLSK